MDISASDSRRRLTVDVALVPAFLSALPGNRANTVYIVVDVIRATTTLCVLFEQGCRRVLLAPGIEAARQARRADRPDMLLAGEVCGLAPAGFHFGNSPSELAAADVAGRTLIFATTNGTQALRACLGGRAIYVGAFRNATAVTARALAIAAARHDEAAAPSAEPSAAPQQRDASEADPVQPAADIVIVCSGRDALPAYDDTVCAGYLVERLLAQTSGGDVAISLREGARIAMASAEAALAGQPVREALASADAALAVERVGLAADLTWCAAVDATTVVPAVIAGTQESSDAVVVEAERTGHATAHARNLLQPRPS